MARPARKHYTWDDYVQLPDDGKRYEIIDGELSVTAAPAFGHQYTALKLCLLLSKWSDERARGQVAFAPVDVVLAPDTVVQPDLIWISKERIREIIGERVTGIPDLVVEILSPSTARRDRHKKSEIYARFDAREYWLVDPKDQSVEIRTRRGTEFVRFAHGTGDSALASALDPGLTVVPSTLFRDFGR